MYDFIWWSTASHRCGNCDLYDTCMPSNCRHDINYIPSDSRHSVTLCLPINASHPVAECLYSVISNSITLRSALPFCRSETTPLLRSDLHTQFSALFGAPYWFDIVVLDDHDDGDDSSLDAACIWFISRRRRVDAIPLPNQPAGRI